MSTNPLAAAVEALEPFANYADPHNMLSADSIITTGSSFAKRQLTMGDCYTAARTLPSLRAALAEAEGAVSLPVRWEWETDGDEDHNLVLYLGPIRLGLIWVAPNGSIRASLLNWPISKSSFHPTLAAAKAALLAAVKGEEK